MASLLLAGCGAGSGAASVAGSSAAASTVDAVDGQGNVSAHLDVGGRRVLVESHVTGAEGAQTRVVTLRGADATSYAELEEDLQTHDLRGSYAGQPFGHAGDVAADADRELWSGIAGSDAARIVAAASRAAEAAGEQYPEAGEVLGQLRAGSDTLDQLASRTALAPEDRAIDPELRRSAADAVGAGPAGVRDCRGAIWSRHHIDILGVNVGWQEADLDYFCWNGSRITSWGQNYAKRWSAPPLLEGHLQRRRLHQLSEVAARLGARNVGRLVRLQAAAPGRTDLPRPAVARLSGAGSVLLNRLQ